MDIEKILITLALILFGTIAIALFIFGLYSIAESFEESRMAEKLCKENNLTFVEDFWSGGNHCAEIKDKIITRYFPEKLNDEEYYLIKR